jgi:2',3'-cyclic-nucleotide 3'-phosphodiesterase
MCAAINKDNSSSKDTAGDPGLSLWLVPTEGSDIYNALAKAITQIVPPTLSISDTPPRFEPHLTLASRIPRQSITSDPQRWLDEIDLPAISTVEVSFQELATGDAFFKKLFIRCKRSDSLLQLAARCRAFSSVNIDEMQYDPHVSIL